MASGTDDTVTVASFAGVLRAPLARPVLAAAMLSTWGDHIARITKMAPERSNNMQKRTLS